MRLHFLLRLTAVLIVPSLGFALPAVAQGQSSQDSGPVAALAEAFTAACRADEAQFAKSLTKDNAAAFQGLPEAQRKMLLQRFSLSSDAGKALLSSDQAGHTILRCEARAGVAEFRFGQTRVSDNLAFIPVTVVDGASDDFGLVREGGGWKLLSLGLLLLDIPKLSVQWADQQVMAQEEAAVAALQKLASAIDTYQHAFGNLPDTLAELGPGAKQEASPEKASLVSEPLAAGDDGGYSFRYRAVSAPDSPNPRYELAAAPDAYGKSGKRSFFRDADGNIHSADKRGAQAGPDDPLIESEKTP